MTLNKTPVYKMLMASEKGLITTPLRALVALVLTGLIAAQNLHSAFIAKHPLKDLIAAGVHPHWHFVAAIVASSLYVALSLVVFAFNPLRKEERLLWLAVAASQLCYPATLLFPRAISMLNPVGIVSSLIAFLAAAMLFKSICEGKDPKEPPKQNPS